MPFKATNSSKTKVSSPAAGTIKSNSKFTGAALGNLSKRLSTLVQSFEKKENSKPTEVISIVDFNRVYERSGASGAKLTPYGQYFKALESVHSITTEDVTYVVAKALENDSTGAWGSFKDNVDASIEDSQDFIQDLTDILNKIEQAERSLDISRTDDAEIRSQAVEYLSSKIKRYHQSPDTRGFNPTDFYAHGAAMSGSTLLKAMLTRLRETIINEFDESHQLILSSLKAPNDLNAKSPGDFWTSLQRPSGTNGKLRVSARILSQVLMLSSGIPKLNSDPISGRISFDPKSVDAIFNGTSNTPRRGKTSEPDKLPFTNRLSKDIGPNYVTLSMLQKNTRDGKIVIPVDIEDDPNEKYFAGSTKLIREAIKGGDYQFTELSEFAEEFEKSRQDLETYCELLVGRCDNTCVLTPDEVLRTVIRYFIKAVEVCEYNKMSSYEMLAVKKSNSNLGLKQAVLQSAGRTKYFQMIANVNSGTSGEESSYEKTVTTVKTSPGESITNDATTNTTQSENKSPNRPVRVVERLASDSPTSTEIKDYVYSILLKEAKDGPPTKQELQKKLEKLRSKLEDYELKRNIAIAAYAAAIAGGAVSGAFTLGAGAAAGMAAAQIALASIAYFDSKVIEVKQMITKTNEDIKNAPVYDNKDNVKQQLYDMTLTTSDTVISCLVDAYNELINAAVSRLPSEQTLTNTDGTTRYGSLDEFGLLSLLVQMFGALADQIEIGASKDSLGNLLLDGSDGASLRSFKVDLKNLIPDNDEYRFDLVDCDEASQTKDAMTDLILDTIRYQNVQAFLSAYSNILLKSKNELILSVDDILSSPGRRETFDNASGRKLMSSLTSQQIIYRRALLDRYLPNSSFGYLPERIRFNQNESNALDTLLSSEFYSKRESENTRIAFVGIPIGTLNESIKYKNEDLGDVNFSGFIELLLYKKDQQFDDIIFKETSYLFDPRLFIVASSFDSIRNLRISPSDDVALRIAKLCTFRLYDRNGQVDLAYNDLKNHERYSKVSAKILNNIVRNTLTSYLLETYVYKVSGMIFDESISLDLDDSVTQSSINALGALSSLSLPDLKLPTASQINDLMANGSVNFSADIEGISTGDKELIAAMTDSFLMKEESPFDRLIATPKFDRVVAISFDPDSFEIDVSKTKRESGEIGDAMLKSMTRAGLLVEKNNSVRVIPRDPASGGFSIGSFSCQFVPHTLNSDGSSVVQIVQSNLIKNGIGAPRLSNKFGESKSEASTSSTSRSRNLSKLSR
jgi:hypothetical protein